MDGNVSIDEMKSVLWSQTDFNTGDTQKSKKASKNLRNVRKQTKQSKTNKQNKKKILECEEEEEVEYIPPRRSAIYGYTPPLQIAGNIEAYEKNVTSQIRQVYGMGFSNDGILHSLGYQRPQNRISSIDIENTNGINDNTKTPPLHEILKTRKKK